MSPESSGNSLLGVAVAVQVAVVAVGLMIQCDSSCC